MAELHIIGPQADFIQDQAATIGEKTGKKRLNYY